MRTTQLLLQIMNKVIENPSTMSVLPWDDIQLCVLTELTERKQIYPSEQYASVEQDVLQLIHSLKNAGIALQTDTFLHYLEEIIVMLQILPDSDFIHNQFENLRFYQANLDHYKKDTIVILGDSHVNFFAGNEQLNFKPIGHGVNVSPLQNDYPFTVLHLGPCLAYNSNNYASSSQFRQKADYLCEHFLKPHTTIICSLGEIDLRVHVFRQTEKQHKTYEEIVDAILEQYLAFLCSLQDKGYQVYCWGPIATQKDSCPLDPNFPRIGSEVMRNKATAYFNEQLATLCAQHGIGFLSIFPQMITDKYETLDQYLSPDRCHLGQAAMLLAIEEFQKINHPTLRYSLP